MANGTTFPGARWRLFAACSGEDPNRFFSTNGRPSNSALAPCEECPVRQECLDHALAAPWEPHGVWGGLHQKDVQSLWFEAHPGVRHQPDSSFYRRLLNDW